MKEWFLFIVGLLGETVIRPVTQSTIFWGRTEAGGLKSNHNRGRQFLPSQKRPGSTRWDVSERRPRPSPPATRSPSKKNQKKKTRKMRGSRTAASPENIEQKKRRFAFRSFTTDISQKSRGEKFALMRSVFSKSEKEAARRRREWVEPLESAFPLSPPPIFLKVKERS